MSDDPFVGAWEDRPEVWLGVAAGGSGGDRPASTMEDAPVYDWAGFRRLLKIVYLELVLGLLVIVVALLFIIARGIGHVRTQLDCIQHPEIAACR